jgi:PAS domain S-box-containing protein
LVGHHELLLNAIRDAIFVVSRTGKIISSNAAAADLAEREINQLTGHSITNFVLEYKTSGLVTWKAHFLADPVKTGVTKERISAYLKKPNGTVIPIRVSCFPTRDTDYATGAVITIYSGV